MKIKLYGVLFLTLMVLLFNSPGCKYNIISSENMDAEGSLQNYGGCKDLTANTFQGQDSANQGKTQECITFEYTGNTLKLKHVNAYLNCCPGEICAEIDCQGQNIVITEEEASLGCLCDCYYDIDYQINNINRGTYTISIHHGNSVKLQCTIDLSSTVQGELCN